MRLANESAKRMVVVRNNMLISELAEMRGDGDMTGSELRIVDIDTSCQHCIQIKVTKPKRRH